MTPHPDPAAIAAYAGMTDLDEVTTWAVEVHLEACAECRARMAQAVPAGTRTLLDRVAAGVERELAAGRAPARRAPRLSALRRRTAAAGLGPWVVMTVTVLLCAASLQHLLPDLPSLVLLLAPVAPLPGVAAAWSHRLDPAGELIASTPAAGLTMLLRRTLAVLAVVVPVLAVAGLGSTSSPALLLLPALAFTAGTLALGCLVGVPRAAIALGSLWALAVVVPTVAVGDLPVLLHPDSAAIWAAATVLLTGVVLGRADDFRRLASHA
jgi:hypothetical protein